MWVKIAKSVTSDPEPEVVGIATSLASTPLKNSIALAQSIALPPPSATITSGANSLTRAVPFAASSTDGSGSTSEKISTVSAAEALAILPAVPFFAKKGSVTRNSLFDFISFSAATAPVPEMIFVLQ